MESDRELRHFALTFWANYIETGNPTLSANDAIDRGILPNKLNENQRKAVVRIRELAGIEYAQ